jgi:DNA-binding response OmpR family regulator
LARISCALLDLDLGPGPDGCDLAQALRKARAELPIAFFSSSSTEPQLARARQLGPVFAKPAQIDEAIAWTKRAAG